MKKDDDSGSGTSFDPWKIVDNWLKKKKEGEASEGSGNSNPARQDLRKSRLQVNHQRSGARPSSAPTPAVNWRDLDVLLAKHGLVIDTGYVFRDKENPVRVHVHPVGRPQDVLCELRGKTRADVDTSLRDFCKRYESARSRRP